MPTTARSVLRQRISGLDGTYVSGTTTTNLTTNNTLVDTKLANVGYHNASSLVDAWLWVNTTNNANSEHMISANTAGGSLTTRGTAFAAESGSVAFEIHKRFKPSDIHTAINTVIDTYFGSLFQEVENVTLHTVANQTVYDLPSGITKVRSVRIENPLGPKFDANILHKEGYSVDFGAWAVSTRPDGSQAANAITLTQYGGTGQQDEFTFGNNYLCKCVPGAGAGSHSWTNLGTPANYYGITLTYEEIIYCKTASKIRVFIDDDGSTTTYSSYHGGTGWERVRVTATVGSGGSALTAGVSTAASSPTFYRKSAILSRAETYLELAWPEVDYFEGVFNGKLKFRRVPITDRLLMVLGETMLSSLSADTDTVEVSGPQEKLLSYATLLQLYKQLGDKYAHISPNPYAETIGRLSAEVYKLKVQHGMGTLPMRRPPQIQSGAGSRWRR